MRKLITFEERGGTNDVPSPARMVTDEANHWIVQHNAEILHMTAAHFVDHERELEDYTLTLCVEIEVQA